MKELSTQIVICGAGPAGLMLAHLLGARNVNVVLLEKLASTVTEPRAIAIDGESLRTLQQLGLLQGFEGELLTGLTADYINSEGTLLFQAGSPELRPYGFATVNSFDQPALDRYLAQAMAQRESVQLCFGHALEGFEQDAQGVRVQCTDERGESLLIRGDYLVGCDGGRSTIRSLLGIEMRGESNPQPWLVIDTIDPHLDGQLDCRFFCDPERPGMTIRKRHGERRWEWMLMPGEDREFLLEDENIRNIIAPYTDVDKVEIYRKRVYDFHAIIARRWREGRVFLAGDAAHMTPPFAGQGLNSGFRDVSNLSWKLAAVVKGEAGASILDSYELERRDHAWELIETALDLGRQIQPVDPAQAAERDAFFAEINKDPASVKALENEMFSSIMARSVDSGLIVAAGEGTVAGKLLIQPELVAGDGRAMLLDDALGAGFSILGYNCDPAQVLDKALLSRWLDIGARPVAVYATGQADSHCLLDGSGELGEWLGSQGASIVLVRPDRFCMACAAPGSAAAELERALEMLGAPGPRFGKSALQ
jgi:3-(3-hydroxy-phenyl)propionate hydroxylase